MPETPVTKLMCQYRNNFLCLALLNQGVINHNMLLPWHAKEISIAVSTSLATINNIKLMKRELQPISKSLNTSLQVARLERRQLVEKGENRNRVYGNHEDLKASSKQPKIVKELIPSLLHDRQETSQDRRSENKCQHLRLQHIHHKQLWSLLVEAKFLLQDECMVD